MRIGYIGDEMLAMWGAPAPAGRPGARTVRAGLAMLDALDAVDQH